MSKRKPRITRICAVCGAPFETTEKCCQMTCSTPCSVIYRHRMHAAWEEAHRDEINARRAAKYREERRRAAGISEARMAEIDAAQDTEDADIIAANAATWTPAERKYATDRYCRKYGLYRSWYEF